jgi:hypothetical protein
MPLHHHFPLTPTPLALLLLLSLFLLVVVPPAAAAAAAAAASVSASGPAPHQQPPVQPPVRAPAASAASAASAAPAAPAAAASDSTAAQQHAATTSLASTVGWQEHSKNDMRGWEQMLRKGGRNFKVDPNYQPTLFCRSQKNVRNTTDSRGCFILNHDNPIPLLGVTRSDYNTTDDIVDVISSPRYARYFGPEARLTWAEPFIIALCFKNSPTICPESAAAGHRGHSEQEPLLVSFNATAAWHGLVNDFYATAMAAVERLDLHVTFVLDGDAAGGNLCSCLQNKWRPWTATYIPGGGQAPGDCLNGAFVSNVPPMDRFQVLNADTGARGAKSLASMASRHFGKFINSTLNYQVYEPKDQAEILDRLGEYTRAGTPQHACMWWPHECLIQVDQGC